MENENNQIRVYVSRTINLGDYDSMKIEGGFSRTLEEGEDPFQLIERNVKRLALQIEQQALEIEKKNFDRKDRR